MVGSRSNNRERILNGRDGDLFTVSAFFCPTLCFLWSNHNDMRFTLSLLSLLLILLPAVQAQSSPEAGSLASQIAAHSRMAQQYLSEKRPDLAIPELKTVVQLDPNNLQAQANLGVLLYFKGQYGEANDALRKALDLHPGIARLQALLGMSEEHSGEPAQAVKDLSAALPDLTDKPIALEAGMALIHLYQQNGQLAEAAEVVKQLRGLAPKNPELLYVAYRLYSDLADEATLRLLLVAPDSAQMHAVMAHIEGRQGDTQAAIAQYRKALAIDPTLPGAQNELAHYLQNANDMKEQQEAASIYEAAIRANPYDVPSYVALGDMNLTQANFKQAQSYYEQALKIDPKNAEANYGLAKVLIDHNQIKEALPLLEKSLEADPTNDAARFHLAMIERRMGNEKAAREQLQIFQKMRQLKDSMSRIYKNMRNAPLPQPTSTSAASSPKAATAQ